MIKSIEFNVTGEERKALVEDIGDIERFAAVYKGMPSFAYVVKNLTIDRNGTLSWDERTDANAIMNLLTKLAERGYAVAEKALDEYENVLTKLQKTDAELILMQVKAIRDTGITNMLDTRRVQRLAFDREFYDLVCLIEEDKAAYTHLIITGELKQGE